LELLKLFINIDLLHVGVFIFPCAAIFILLCISPVKWS
jgi:hypothetical protein